MKHIIFLFLFGIFLFQSCKKIDVNEGVPSYISIPSIEVITDPANEGSNSHKITDAWVYFDNNLQGVYPLPTTFPVLLSGKQNISIKAGIKNNGIAATRVNYPFYDYFKEEVFLTKATTTIIKPEVRYFDNAKFHIIDFETGSKEFEEPDSSDITFLFTKDTVFEGSFGGGYLVASHKPFEIATAKIDSFPRIGTPIYVELNYKCNTPFQIGVFAHFLPQTVTTTSIVTINPKSEWNKIYIDLTSTIINTNIADFHKVFISMKRDINSTEMAELYLDNFKIVY